MSLYTYKKAFTLAEVLITLMILGVIAMLVVPSAIQKANDRATVVQVKKVYSELSRAMSMAIAENGTLDQWDWPSRSSYNADNAELVGQNIKKYLSIKKYCGLDSSCFNYTNTWKTLQGTDGPQASSFQHGGRMVLTNGMRLYILQGGLDFDSVIVVDINGVQEPNRYGYDIFVFPFGKNGMNVKSHYRSGQANLCNINNTSSWNGENCRTWILKHNNMDYKYRDVSAEW